MDNQDKASEAKVDSNTIESEISKQTPLQSEQILQWRQNLTFLKEDKDFTSIADKAVEAENNELSTVIEAIEYLDQKNILLDENDDFILSDSGFLKYKSKHMLVFDYLSSLTKPDESNSKFYLVSRTKHIAQQHKVSNGMHSLVHFLFIVAVIFVLAVASLVMVVQTQQNIVVEALLLWLWFIHLKSAAQLIKPFKKTAATPFRFRVSLLGIHALNTFIKVSLLCFIPIGIALVKKHYWVDDVIIISLAALCFFHFKTDSKQQIKIVDNDNIKEEIANV